MLSDENMKRPEKAAADIPAAVLANNGKIARSKNQEESTMPPHHF
jgi:hypothetical protein